MAQGGVGIAITRYFNELKLQRAQRDTEGSPHINMSLDKLILQSMLL